MSVDSVKNYKLLLQLNFFLGIGLGIVSATGLFDLLYLRMQFDLAWFGFIRSCMFFLPALCYFGIAPLLKGTPYSREIVQWSFFVRIGIVILIPFAALFTENKIFLLSCAAFCTTVAYVAAAFANNTLMVLYRQLLPQELFNQKSAVISAAFSITPAVVSLIGAAILSAYSSLSNRNFYLLFILLELVSGIFELLLFRINRKLILSADPVAPVKIFSYSAYFHQAFAGLHSPKYRQLLFVTATCCFWGPLIDTYLSVYLYKVQNFSAFTVLLFLDIAIFSGAFIGIPLAKWCDRIGYLKFFRIFTAVIIILSLLFGFFLECRWFLILFLLLVNNGSCGLLTGIWSNLRGAAASKLAPATGGESYVAVFSLVQMLSEFFGALCSGWLFAFCQHWMEGAEAKTFACYFQICGILSCGLLFPLFNRSCVLLGKNARISKIKKER